MSLTISSIRIQHYKSLRDVWLKDVPQTMLIVGRNAVGKSNLMDALRFVRDAVVDGLDHAISSRGGIEVIRQYSRSRPFNVSFRIEFEQRSEEQDNPRPASYEFKITSKDRGNYQVERESAEWWYETFTYEDTDSGQLSIERDSLVASAFTRNSRGEVTVQSGGEELVGKVKEDDLALRSTFFDDGPDELSAFLSTLRFSALFPNTLRAPARPDTDKRLKESGENWASVLKALKQTPRGKQAFATILSLMSRVMPDLVDVRVTAVSGYLAPKFVVRQKGNEHSFDPVQLSDGTLRVFGILLGLYQVPRPEFFAIEEPELTVNPGVLAVLADAFREVESSTQLIITTHSPNLVDLFSPEQVRVVTMEGGDTQVAPIKPTQVEAVKEKLVSLADLVAQDNLEPAELPL